MLKEEFRKTVKGFHIICNFRFVSKFIIKNLQITNVYLRAVIVRKEVRSKVTILKENDVICCTV